MNKYYKLIITSYQLDGYHGTLVRVNNGANEFIANIRLDDIQKYWMDFAEINGDTNIDDECLKYFDGITEYSITSMVAETAHQYHPEIIESIAKGEIVIIDIPTGIQ